MDLTAWLLRLTPARPLVVAGPGGTEVRLAAERAIRERGWRPALTPAEAGTARRTRAARGRLARLVVVLAVLAGLGYAVGLQCAGGMAPGMVMAHGATSSDAVVACASPPAMGSTAEPVDTRQCVAPAAVFAVAEHDSSDLGGVLATCLAFLIAVVAAVTALLPGRLRRVAHASQPARVTVRRAGRPRPPRLAELCVLRT